MKWRFENCVLGTYEIENAIRIDNKYISSISKLFRYVDTSICYNNDLYLNKLLKNRSIKVISKIPPQMTNQYEFMLSNHLKCLGRRSIDIMLIHNSRSEWKDLAKRLEEDHRIREVGVSNFSINDLEDYNNVLGHYPKYNEMEINPGFYDKDLIEFCHNNGIKIIAYAILGGKYNARMNISKYTHPYLLSFAGYNAEFLILRSDNSNRLLQMVSYLNNIYRNVMNIEDTRMFERESSDNKSILPTSYSTPEIYIRGLVPTNYDQILLNNDLVFSKGYHDIDLKDDLSLSSIDLPKYEFVSDYRVYFRYKINEYLHKMTGRCPEGFYLYPSTYIASVKNGWIKRMKGSDRTYALVSLNLLTNNKKLSKIDDGNCKFMIESKILY